ncbi:FG-GAP repeat protein [Nitrosomonas sp. Nm84]|uniref:integrin alpha n=1 Tax=Nitrosomonas sp. Nm84 TaxID=200124 RepID=UPI000D75F6BC|nr:integrin alpha [Nitrosomonas sp. Nm84]PXW88245.1 FG-GAP repeat protein [Nitrosomonas sp. Nm84]
MAITTINLSSLDGNNGFRLDGAIEDGYSGRSVSNAGDVNGDGFADVIIGAPAANISYVVFGKAAGFDAVLNLSSLDGSSGFSLNGPAGDFSGLSVSNAGDVNSDGFDDVIVGTYGANASYVVFGKASGFGATLDLSSLDGSNGFLLEGAATDDVVGREVSNAGDINGDGFDDVMVSAVDFSAYPQIGSSYVVFGKAAGFGATLDLSNLDGNNGFSLDGAAAYGASSISVSSAGDVNGDGFDDVTVGVLGAGYVIFGKASGFDATMDLSSLDGSNGFFLDGATNELSLSSVSSAGDIDGDGFADLIMGGRATVNGQRSDASFVVFGKASGFDATLDLSNLDGSNGFTLYGGNSAADSVSSAGDVNGDGFADLLIGADGADPHGTNSGSSYVVFGKADDFNATIDLSSLDSNSGFRLDGVGAFDSAGVSVSSAGDINNDGFDDLIVGAPGADVVGDDFGTSYVIFGRSNFGSDNVIEGTPGDDNLRGISAAEHFIAGDGNDSLIGRGGADIFEGESGDDNIRVADLGFASVDGGAGNDVLHLDGSGLNMNLADFEDKISDIETICLYGKGDNTLTLTAVDLLNLSDTSNTLKVNGNAGDRIVLDGDWTDGGSRGSGYYHVYTHDDAVLLVGQNVTVDFA